MDFLKDEKKLDLPPDENAEVMRELRGHYEDLLDELTLFGMTAKDTDIEAERRFGSADEVAYRLRRVHCSTTWSGLFPPKDFIPTSAMWGVWAGAVLAGVNYMRMGNRALGWRVIGIGIAIQLAIGWSLSLIFRSNNPTTFPYNPWCALASGVDFIINGLAGLYFFRMQNRLYVQWAALHKPKSRESPYLAWWVSLLAILGALVIVFLLALILIK